jgi:hypothetical protein
LTVPAFAGIIAALTLKRTIDTVRPFLTLAKTEVLSGESREQTVVRLTIRNTGSVPAEEVVVHLSWSESRGDANASEVLSQTLLTPTIFPTEDRIITHQPGDEIVRLLGDQKARFTLSVAYQSAQKKYYTTRTMDVLRGTGPVRNNFIFGLLDTTDSWN